MLSLFLTQAVVVSDADAVVVSDADAVVVAPAIKQYNIKCSWI